MLKSKSILAGTLLVLFALALLLSPTNALAKKHQAKAKGPISAIDPVAATVTIEDKKTGESVTVTVDGSTRIHKDNKEWATLEDLAIGDTAKARYNKDTLLAKRIQAKSPKLEGTITAIDVGAQSVTIQPTIGDPVTVFATETTKIERNDEEATLADLVVGDQAQAKYNAETFEAYKIEATGP